MKHPVVYSKINDDLGMIPMLGILRRNYQSDESSSCQNLHFVPNTLWQKWNWKRWKGDSILKIKLLLKALVWNVHAQESFAPSFLTNK